LENEKEIELLDEEALEEELAAEIRESLEEDQGASKVSYEAPNSVFVLPLSRRPFFPGMAAPIVIEPGAFYEVLKVVAKSEHKCMGLFLTHKEDVNIYKATFEDLYQVGVLARILRIIPMEQGAQVVLNMERRISVKKVLKTGKAIKVQIAYHDDQIGKLSKEVKAYSISIITTIKELLKLNPLFKEELQIFLGHSDFTEPGKLADFAVALTTASREELQDVLETYDLQGRIDKALVLLKKELDLSKLQNSINQKIEATISQTQREFFLKEQLKTIKKELGLEKDDKTHDIEKFEARLKKRTVPEDVKKVITEEIEKLSVLEIHSAEYAVCRNYLDWLTILPWGITTATQEGEGKLDLSFAKGVLEEDHYGLEDIKERVLEFIAVGKLSGGVKGSIICLVGPPGVGKTSIGKSVARALKRPFYRFSVGGMRDEAEIKGHRRTYIGAMPGKLIQALKFTQVMNPVIMLDEVDKMRSSYQGDPASALLEVLDPEQNKDFLDHYIDVRCDLSHVLFILTANVLDTIPEPLKDRMDILRLSGYILQEKVKIAEKYLIPRNRLAMGLQETQIDFTLKSIGKIINGYARESGVRGLENYIKKVLRKVAVEVVKHQEKKKKGPFKKAVLSDSNLEKYIGKPIFTSDRIYQKTPVGVCMGLAWTALGGATLYIEATKVPAEKTELKVTGQLGDVMKESSQIAWTYVQSQLHAFATGIPFFKNSGVHIHVPEGATPKDGPSAGITMVTALLSLLRNEPILENLGMTGEITLTGKVLPIGGVKEKMIAAKRSGAKILIFPWDNRSDYDKLPRNVKENIKVHFVKHYKQVFDVAFQKS
jgi:ATP-dependent Lon protease